jgi:hypothetical protein
MGADGKMTLGPQMKTLGDYSVSGINPPALPPGPVNQNFTGTPLGGFGGGYDDGNKSLGADSLDAGMSNPQMPNAPTPDNGVLMYGFGQSKKVLNRDVAAMLAQGWSFNPGGGQS